MARNDTFRNDFKEYAKCLTTLNIRHFSIYFVQSGNGAIKIGCTIDMGLRLIELQGNNPELLTVLKTVSGTPLEETAIHRKFKRDRIRGEWFKPSLELLRFIDTVTDENLMERTERYKAAADRDPIRRRIRLKDPDYEAAL